VALCGFFGGFMVGGGGLVGRASEEGLGLKLNFEKL
jgi:hypothetical protein